MDLISEIRTVYDNYDFDTQILAASIRNTAHVRAAAIAGADCATLPPAVFQDMIKHPLTEKGLEQFNADWAKTGQSIL
jgi:transaldolase